MLLEDLPSSSEAGWDSGSQDTTRKWPQRTSYNVLVRLAPACAAAARSWHLGRLEDCCICLHLNMIQRHLILGPLLQT